MLKSNFFSGAGLEKYARNIAKTFHDKGCSVTILTTGKIPEGPPAPLFNLVSFEINKILSVQRVAAFDKLCAEYLEQHQAPIIFSLDRNRFQTHLRLGNGVHAAYLQHRKKSESWLKNWSFSLNPLHRTILKLEKTALANPDLKLLITNSNMVKEEVLQYYATDPAKIKVLHNGVEWHAMQSDFDAWPQTRRDFANSLQIDPDVFHFLFAGNNFRRKGLDHLLKALFVLKDKNFHLSVIGNDKNKRAFEALTEKLNLRSRVTFFGPRSDTRSFYQLADAVIIPSLYDPFANVTVEALAMGLFVVSSKTNGGHEILHKGNGAVIEQLDNPEAFAECLRTALIKPKTKESASSIRASVKHMDFSLQLDHLTSLCLP